MKDKQMAGGKIPSEQRHFLPETRLIRHDNVPELDTQLILICYMDRWPKTCNMTNSDNSEGNEISLVEIDSQRRASTERTQDGQSGPILYQIKYHNEEGTIVRGKSAELGCIADSGRMDLKAIQGNKYTHYGIFRLQDRSTVTIVQDKSKNLYKILSLGRNTVKIAHPVTITEPPE